MAVAVHKEDVFLYFARMAKTVTDGRLNLHRFDEYWNELDSEMLRFTPNQLHLMLEGINRGLKKAKANGQVNLVRDIFGFLNGSGNLEIFFRAVGRHMPTRTWPKPILDELGALESLGIPVQQRFAQFRHEEEALVSLHPLPCLQDAGNELVVRQPVRIARRAFSYFEQLQKNTAHAVVNGGPLPLVDQFDAHWQAVLGSNLGIYKLSIILSKLVTVGLIGPATGVAEKAIDALTQNDALGKIFDHMEPNLGDAQSRQMMSLLQALDRMARHERFQSNPDLLKNIRAFAQKLQPYQADKLFQSAAQGMKIDKSLSRIIGAYQRIDPDAPLSPALRRIAEKQAPDVLQAFILQSPAS